MCLGHGKLNAAKSPVGQSREESLEQASVHSLRFFLPSGKFSEDIVTSRPAPFSF